MPRSLIDRSSVEYLNVPVTPPPGVTISVQPVKIAVVPKGTTPQTADFKAATWQGTTARLLVGPGQVALTPGVNNVFVRITDSPETPTVHAGTITVT